MADNIDVICTKSGKAMKEISGFINVQKGDKGVIKGSYFGYYNVLINGASVSIPKDCIDNHNNVEHDMVFPLFKKVTEFEKEKNEETLNENTKNTKMKKILKEMVDNDQKASLIELTTNVETSILKLFSFAASNVNDPNIIRRIQSLKNTASTLSEDLVGKDATEESFEDSENNFIDDYNNTKGRQTVVENEDVNISETEPEINVVTEMKQLEEGIKKQGVSIKRNLILTEKLKTLNNKIIDSKKETKTHNTLLENFNKSLNISELNNSLEKLYEFYDGLGINIITQ